MSLSIRRPRRPSSLDIEDLNYLTTSEELGIFRYRRPPSGKRGTLKSLLYYLAKIGRAVPLAFKSPHWKSLKGTQVLAALASRNQIAAVEPILSGMNSAGVLSLNDTVSGPRFPELSAYLRSIPSVAHVLQLKSRAQRYRGTGYYYYLDRYLLTYGYYLTATTVLEELAPRLLVLANDHNMEPRTLQLAAAELGIATAYVQHASVTHGFPALAFDFAFLDGEDAARKYDLPSPHRAKVFLTGIPKADGARQQRRQRTQLTLLGVCVNELDPRHEVLSFIADMRRLRPGLKVVLRPHPRDARVWDVEPLGTTLSNAQSENSFDFLNRVDGIVTGPSNIALEAALVGLRPVFKDFGALGHDHYGFVTSGLCRQASTAQEALNLLTPARNPAPLEGVLKRYCATVDTPFDGRSAELVRQLMAEQVAGGIDLARWRPRQDFQHIDVYELRLG